MTHRGGIRVVVSCVAITSGCAARQALADEVDQARATVVREAVARVAPSIVSIETVGGAQPVRQIGDQRVMQEAFRVADGPTTGLILSAEGLILTSSFNFAREPSVITVTLADGRRFVARLLGRDLIRRIALIQIDARNLVPATWVERSDIRVGQYAVACGHGLGGEAPHLSVGIVSALERRNGSAVQTDARTSPINYGGPLIDLDGRVLGLIVPMAGEGGALAGAEWYDSGIGFAVYRDRVDRVLEDLLAGKILEPGKIGVILGESHDDALDLLDKILPTRGGVEILRVARESPAQEAGLRAGDRIFALDGRSIGDIPDLQRRLSDRAAGEEVALSVKRRWRTMEIKLRLARIADIRGLEPSAEPPAAAPEGEEAPSTQPAAD